MSHKVQLFPRCIIGSLINDYPLSIIDFYRERGSFGLCQSFKESPLQHHLDLITRLVGLHFHNKSGDQSIQHRLGHIDRNRRIAIILGLAEKILLARIYLVQLQALHHFANDGMRRNHQNLIVYRTSAYHTIQRETTARYPRHQRRQTTTTPFFLIFIDKYVGQHFVLWLGYL